LPVICDVQDFLNDVIAIGVTNHHLEEGGLLQHAPHHLVDDIVAFSFGAVLKEREEGEGGGKGELRVDIYIYRGIEK